MNNTMNMIKSNNMHKPNMLACSFKINSKCVSMSDTSDKRLPVTFWVQIDRKFEIYFFNI